MGLNHIFKVIWSKSKNAWVVVSELASNAGKTKTVRVASKGLLVVAVINALGGWVASADYNLGTGSSTLGTDSVAIGVNNTAGHTPTSPTDNDSAVAVGSGNTATGTNNVALGLNNTATGANINSTNVALGYNNIANGSSSGVAVGSDNTAGDGAIAIGDGNNATTGGVAMGYYNSSNASGSIAVGIQSKTTEQDAIAIGIGAQADEINTIAIGNGARASGSGSISIGTSTAPAQYTEVVRIGNGGYVGGSNTVAIGEAHVGSNNAIAIGSTAKAGNLADTTTTDSAIGIGQNARSWNSSSGIAIGSAADASDGERTIAIGKQALAFASEDGVALGYRTSIYHGGISYAPTKGRTAIGAGATVANDYGTAIGAGAMVDGYSYSVALGAGSQGAGYTLPTDATINGVQLKASSFAGVNSSYSTVSVGGGINEAAARQIKNVAAGVVSATSTDAINGSQLYAAIDAISKAGSGSGTGATTLNVAGDNGSTSSVNLGTQSFNITGTDGIVTNASGNGITIGLDAATQAKINNATTNGANKDLSNITATGEQKIKDTAAWNIQVNSNAVEKVQGGDTVAFKDGKNISITNTGKDITVATASTVDFDKVTVGGTTGGVTIDGTSKTIGGLNNATTNDQAVNLGQVKALINTSTVGTSSINYKVNSGTAQATSLVDGFDFSGDNNIQIAADTATTGKINYTLNPNLTGIQSIGGGTSAGNGPTITFNNPAGGTPSVGVNSTLDMGGNKITNLQDGTIAAGSKEGVNGGQLFDVKTDLENKINTISTASPAGLSNRIDKLSGRIDKVGAGSAALAALHPLDFHPDDKWTVSAGYGHYRGASAGAVGAFYRPNEDTLFSISGTLGNGDTQMNAGVNFRIGKKSPTSRTTVAMGREMAEMNARMQELENSNKELRRALTMLLDPSKAAEFPDVPKDHWAYQYISQLAGNGIITGYPDGTFKGDKTMTRYEVATIIYRALQNGAPMDANMERAVTEFAPELQNIRMKHFRVDRISGDDNDRQKVERVRVNNENTSNSDVYGSRIVK